VDLLDHGRIHRTAFMRQNIPMNLGQAGVVLRNYGYHGHHRPDELLREKKAIPNRLLPDQVTLSKAAPCPQQLIARGVIDYRPLRRVEVKDDINLCH